jgi:type II secretory pathway predicted ATPase ExeA
MLRNQKRSRGRVSGSAGGSRGRINLADRLEQRGISYARLAAAIGAGRGTLHRLAAAGVEPSRGGPTLKARIEAYCLEKKLTDAEELFWLWRPATKTLRRKEMHNRIMLSAEALDRFRLDRDPFGLEPRNLEEVFRSRDANRILKLLEDAVRYQGWVALCAEIGAGKTTLIRAFLETMRKDKAVRFWRPAFVDPGKLTARNICEDLVREHVGTPAASHTQLYRQIEKILAEEGRLDHRVCLVIDEAHRLSERTLSVLKNLYELRDDERPLSRLLGIILVGQPPLRDRLQKNHDFREVAERIRVVGLPEFNTQVAAYLDHRLKAAGGSLEKLFDPAAVAQIKKLGRTPQEAGNIAAAAMEGAAGAGLAKVSAQWVAQVTSMEADTGLAPVKGQG